MAGRGFEVRVVLETPSSLLASLDRQCRDVCPARGPFPSDTRAFLVFDFVRQGQFAPPASPTRFDIHNEANHYCYFRGRPDVVQLL